MVYYLKTPGHRIPNNLKAPIALVSFFIDQVELVFCSKQTTMLLFCSFYQSGRSMLRGPGFKNSFRNPGPGPGFNAAKAALGVYLGFGAKKSAKSSR